MFRLGLFLGFCVGFVVGRNGPALVRQVSEFLRRVADRLDHATVEEGRLRPGMG